MMRCPGSVQVIQAKVKTVNTFRCMHSDARKWSNDFTNYYIFIGDFLHHLGGIERIRLLDVIYSYKTQLNMVQGFSQQHDLDN